MTLSITAQELAVLAGFYWWRRARESARAGYGILASQTIPNSSEYVPAYVVSTWLEGGVHLMGHTFKSLRDLIALGLIHRAPEAFYVLIRGQWELQDGRTYMLSFDQAENGEPARAQVIIGDAVVFDGPGKPLPAPFDLDPCACYRLTDAGVAVVRSANSEEALSAHRKHEQQSSLIVNAAARTVRWQNQVIRFGETERWDLFFALWKSRPSPIPMDKRRKKELCDFLELHGASDVANAIQSERNLGYYLNL